MKNIAMSRITNIKAVVFDLDGTLCVQDSFKKYLQIRVFKNPYHWILLFPIFWWMLLSYGIKMYDNNWLKKKTIGLVCRGIRDEEAKNDANILMRNLHWNQEILTILEQCREKGVVTILATASPQIYVDSIQRHFGFDHVLSTLMEKDSSGIWTGGVLGDNCYGEEKKNQLSAWCKQNELDWLEIALFSDSIADLPSFRKVGFAVAVRPKWQLRRSMAEFGIIPLGDALEQFKELKTPLLHEQPQRQ